MMDNNFYINDNLNKNAGGENLSRSNIFWVESNKRGLLCFLTAIICILPDALGLIPSFFPDNSTVSTVNGVVITLLRIILFFTANKVLFKDFRKTLFFAGLINVASVTVNLLISFADVVMQYISYDIINSAYSYITAVIESVVSLVLALLFVLKLSDKKDLNARNNNPDNASASKVALKAYIVSYLVSFLPILIVAATPFLLAGDLTKWQATATDLSNAIAGVIQILVYWAFACKLSDCFRIKIGFVAFVYGATWFANLATAIPVQLLAGGISGVALDGNSIVFYMISAIISLAISVVSIFIVITLIRKYGNEIENF